MVYVVTYRMPDGQQGRWNVFNTALRELKAQRIIDPYAWLIESEKSAQELYLELAQHMELPHTDTLFIAEITTNSVGSYIGALSTSPDLANAIAKLIGKARRD